MDVEYCYCGGLSEEDEGLGDGVWVYSWRCGGEVMGAIYDRVGGVDGETGVIVVEIKFGVVHTVYYNVILERCGGGGERSCSIVDKVLVGDC